VRTAKVDVSGTVRVSVAPAFVLILTRGMLPGVRAEYPDLDIELGGAYQPVDLARGEADIALRMARPEEPDLVARRAFDLGWFVHASKAYLDAQGYTASFEELRQHRLVLLAVTESFALGARRRGTNISPVCALEDSLKHRIAPPRRGRPGLGGD